jgi:predicted thioesterase
MTNAIAIAELAAIAATSFALAAALEWLCLRGLMQLMPARGAQALRTTERAARHLQPTPSGLLRVFSTGLHG